MSDMNSKKTRVLPSLTAASGLYLLAVVALFTMSLWSPRLETAIRGVFPNLGEFGMSLATDFLYYVPMVILPAVLWARKSGDAEHALRLNPVSFGMTVRMIVLAIAVLSLVDDVDLLWNVLLQKLGLNIFAFDEFYVSPQNSAELLLQLISVCVAAPLAEELLFRGAILNSWKQRGVGRALVFTSVLFALMHGSVQGLPSHLIAGFMMTLLALWTDSLYAGMIFHSAYNAMVTFMNYLSTGRPRRSADRCASAAPPTPPWARRC